MAAPKSPKLSDGGTGPHYCPYCGDAFEIRDELVDHLTLPNRCHKSSGYIARHRSGGPRTKGRR